MKKFLTVGLILILAGGVIWNQRQQLARSAAERERLRVELEQVNRRAAEVEGRRPD